MFFSIIVPVYNVERYLERFFDSVISQDYDKWEMILVDDGSSDGSGKMCDDLASGDPRISVIHKENGGASSARNLGLTKAKGDLVMFLDPDDWTEKSLLSEYLKGFEKGADLVACDYNVVSETEEGLKIVKGNKFSGSTGRIIEGKGMYPALLRKSATISNKVMKRDLVSDLRFDENMSFGEDTHFLIRALERVRSIYITDYAGYNYLVNRLGNTVSASLGSRDLEFLGNNKKIYDILSDSPDKSIGVHRINMAVNQILDKMWAQNFDYRSDRTYLPACKELARYPKFKHVVKYLTNPDYTVKNRLRFLSFRISPVIWLRRLLKKEYKGV